MLMHLPAKVNEQWKKVGENQKTFYSQAAHRLQEICIR